MSKWITRLKDPIRKSRVPTLCTAIVLVVVGCILLVLNFRHNGRYSWRPIQIPIQIKAGETVKASFVPEIDEAYEIEFEFQRRISREELETIVESLDRPSPLDIHWSVLVANEVIAEGSCRDYLYVETGGNTPSLLKRVGWRLFNSPYKQTGPKTISTSIRGVGKFDGKAGREYTISVQVNKTIDVLNQTNPMLGVRLNRVFGVQHMDEAKSFVIGGLAALALALTLFTWWGITPLCRISDKLIPLLVMGVVVIGVVVMGIFRLTYASIY